MKKLCCYILFIFFVVSANAQCWQSVSGGLVRSAGIKSDGTIWAWGDNGVSVLGTGSTFSVVSAPEQIGVGNTWQSVSAGGTHIMAIQNNGTLWGWGGNFYGQLGLGTSTNIYTNPMQVGMANNWQSVVAGHQATFAIKSDGTLWAWGANNGGQFGDGTTVNRNFPVQIGTDTDWQSVSMGWYDRAMAIKTNGTLWVWGSGSVQMGLGTSLVTAILPTQIGTDNNWQSLSVGIDHTLAIKTNGTLWSWGSNYDGELGNGNNISTSIPGQVGTAFNWQSISTNYLSNVAHKTDGTIWSWGENTSGTLGNGTTINSNVSIQIGSAINWQSISAGDGHCLAIQTNGTLWTWGLNVNGQLGDNTTIDRYTPVEIQSGNLLANATATSICSGSAVTLNGAGATTYTWSSSVNNGVSFVPTTSAIYTVTGTDAIGCYNTATVGITVNPYTTVTASATSTNVCVGATVTLTGSGAANYVWSGNVINGQSFSPTGTATYSVTDTTGCSNTASITVNVIPLPIVSVNSTTICAGITAVLTASATPIAGTTYVWSTANTGNVVNVSPIANTFYTVTATNTGCSASAVASVSVTAVVAPVTGFSYNSPLCTTAANPLPNGVSGFSNGGVYGSTTGLSINSATGLIDLNLSNAGTYVVTYSVAANGCNPSSNNTFTITLNAPTTPITGFNYLAIICQKDINPSPVLASNFATGGTFNSAGLTINPTNGIIDLSTTAAGTYTVSYTVNAANCVQAGSNTQTVTVNPNPILTTSSSTVIITGGQTVLTATSSANTYNWFPITNLSCSTCATPTASPDQTTIYCVQTTDGVCTNSACITVNVETLCEGDKGLYLPNAFSPNGDGTNDIFCVQGSNRCVTDFTMIIYDRWGEKVFESSDLSFCWDGIFKGKQLNPDVYVYYVKAKDQYQKDIIKKGNVTLIK